MNTSNKVKKLALAGVLIALVTVLTAVIHIPIPGTQGYVNLGDAVLIFTGLLLGPLFGGLTGGIGSALADLLLGYTIYVPITLVVKGLEGALAGVLMKSKLKEFPLLIGMLCGLWMAFGYYICEIFLYGHLAALASVPANLGQGAVGAVVGTLLYARLKNTQLLGRSNAASPNSLK